MFDKPQASHVLGLDVDDFSFKAAAISFSRGKLKIDAMWDGTIGAVEEDKLQLPPEEMENLQRLCTSHLTVTGAGADEVLVRPLEMRLSKEKEIDAALSFEVEPLLPYPIENGIVDRILLSQGKEGSALTVMALRKDHLENHLNHWKALGIESEVVSAAPFAAAQFAGRFVSTEEAYFVLHLGFSRAFAIVVDKGKLVAAQTLSGGIAEFLDAMGSDDRQQAFHVLRREGLIESQAMFKAALQELRMMTARTLFALGKQFKGSEINKVLLTGPGAVIPGLEDALLSSLQYTRLEFPEGIVLPAPKEELLLYAVPLGLALSAFHDSHSQINFRQQEFAYPEPWKRLKRPILQYLSLCFGIALSLVLFAHAYTAYKENEVKRSYLELLTVMQKSYPDFEREFRSKYSSGQVESADILPIDSLNQEEIDKRLSVLEKEIQATPQIFPLRPNIPLVSDVLAWIATHPHFVGKGGEDALKVENFNYAMIKRPEPAKKHDKYQVKIELEFSSPSPKRAREFHDALIAPNEMLDPKGEIKWNSNRDLYKTSFYLKDRTIYPNL